MVHCVVYHIRRWLLVYGGCYCRPISVKRNLKIKVTAVVSECNVCYRVVAH